MAGITGLELAEFAKSKLGTPYVYGMKGEKLTTKKLEQLHKLYPKSLNYELAKKHIGKDCTDCSGLISWITKELLSSNGLKAKAEKEYPISKIENSPIGTVVWKSGHVGVYIGRNKNGEYAIVEAMGAKYGTVESLVSKRSFTRYLIEPFIKYPSSVKTNRKLALYKENFNTEEKYLIINKDENVFYHKDMKNGWSMVEYRGYIGYVKNIGLTKKNLSKYKSAEANVRIYIRSSNTAKPKKENIIKTLPKDTKIEKVISKRGNWYEVSVQKTRGWVYGRKINLK